MNIRSIQCFSLALVACGLIGCAQPHKTMYMWEAFPRQQYDYLIGEGSGSEEQIRLLEAHAEKARASGAVLPPGFRAHLGMLKLRTGDPQQAQQLWQQEKAAFPESAPYMDQLLKRLEDPKSAANNTKKPT